MEFFDRFKKKDKKKKQTDLTTDEKSLTKGYESISEEMSADELNATSKDIVDEGQQLLNKYMANYEARQKETEKARESFTALDKGLDNLGNNRANNNPFRGFQQEFFKEKTKEEFAKKYEKINSLRTAIISREKMGMTPNFSQKELVNYYAITDNVRGAKEILFIPYLEEKSKLGILTESEKKELSSIYSLTSEKTEKSNHYVKALIYLQMIGVINIEDSTIFEKTFEEYTQDTKFTRKDIKEASDYFINKGRSVEQETFEEQETQHKRR